ncbi:MAG: multidrug effflux MFS transporter [Hyphomicrobiales bacterium]|nr:multidrug effflux MFS transporter [Hyphomicrobiales bacterium]
MLKPNTVSMTTLLALLTAFGPVATDMYVPSMPDIGRLLETSPAGVQLTLSSYLVGFAIGQIVYGPVSDRFGRKPTLLAALLLFCAASLACALAPTIEFLIVARACQALGGAGAIVIPRAVVRDLYSGERAVRELSRMGAIMSFAPVAAPLIGAFVQTGFGWRANFVIIVAIGVLTTLVTWRALPETLPPRDDRPVRARDMLRWYRALLASPPFLAYLGIIACSYAGLFAWISGSSFVLQNLYAVTPMGFGILFAASCIGAIAGATIASTLVMRIGLDRTIGIGVLALAGGGLAMLATLMAGLEPVSSLVVTMTLYHVGLMLAMPQSIAGAITPFAACAGTASSLIGFVQQTSAATLGAIVGHGVGQSGLPLALAIAMMGSLALLVWALTRRIRSAAVDVTPDWPANRSAGGRLKLTKSSFTSLAGSGLGPAPRHGFAAHRRS